MTKSELNGFRNALQKKQTELSNGGRGRADLAIETSSDEGDRIQSSQDRDFAIGALDRDSILLREVRAAFNRLRDGTFGLCLDCEEPISLKRLAAVPWTASCIVCRRSADDMAGQPWRVGGELLASAD